jgi:tetratricopeptide (TPR) repeat protein
MAIVDLLAHEDSIRRLIDDGRLRLALGEFEKYSAVELLADSSEVAHARLTLELANLLRDLALYFRAEPLYLTGLAGLVSLVGKDHPEYANGLSDLAKHYDFLAKYDKAQSFYQKALAIHEANTNSQLRDPLGHVRCLQNRSALLDRLGQRDQARSALDRARELLVDVQNPLCWELVRQDMHEAWLLCRTTGILSAVERLRNAVAQAKQFRGDNHWLTALAIHRLGRLLLNTQQADESERLLNTALAIRRECLGERHPETAVSHEALAMLAMEQSKWADAEKSARLALEIMEEVYGSTHPDTLETLSVLGHVLHGDRQLVAAQECYTKAIEHLHERFGEHNHQVFDTKLDLTYVLEARGLQPEAIAQMRSLIDDIKDPRGNDRFEALYAHECLARLLQASGELQEAYETAKAGEAIARSATVEPFSFGPLLLLLIPLEMLCAEKPRVDELLQELKQLLEPLPPHHRLQLQAVNCEARLLRMIGRSREAVDLVRNSLQQIETTSSDSLGLVATLHMLAEEQYLSGDWIDSERSYERVLELQRRKLGPEHPAIAFSLRGLAQLHMGRGNLQAAELRFRQALDIRRHGLPDDHPDVAESLHDLANVQQQAGQLMPAETLYMQAIEIRSKALGEAHPETVASMHALATAQSQRGDFAEAAKTLERALELLRADKEDEHPHTLDLRRTLAMVCQSLRDAPRAKTLLERTLQGYEKRFGKDTEGVIGVLQDLARLNNSLGDGLAALAIYDRIESIRQEQPSPDPQAPLLLMLDRADVYRFLGETQSARNLSQLAHDQVARIFPGNAVIVGYQSHLARMCQVNSQFGQARRLFGDAIRIAKIVGGVRCPMVGSLTGELGSLEFAAGKKALGCRLLEESADILRDSIGEDSAEHAYARRTLGLSLQSAKLYPQAQSQLERYQAITRRSLGTEHAAMASCLQLLADLARARGDLGQAKENYREALGIIQRSETPFDAMHANLLHSLALVQRLQGQSKEAMSLLQNALEIDKSSLGEESTPHLDTLLELAQLEAANGKDAEALEQMLHVFEAHEKLLPVFAAMSPCAARDTLLDQADNVLARVLTLLRPDSDANAVRRAWACVLRHKNITKKQRVGLEKPELLLRYAAHKTQIERLIYLSRQLTTRLLNGPGYEGLNMHRQLLASWREEREKILDELAAKIPEFKAMRDRTTLSAEQVQGRLGDQEVLIELMFYTPWDFAALCVGNDKGQRTAPRYLAFVVTKESVACVDLGEATSIDRHIGWFRTNREGLRQSVLAPLGGKLPPDAKIILATAGKLAKVKWGSLLPGVRQITTSREI